MTRFSDQTIGILQLTAAGALLGTVGICVLAYLLLYAGIRRTNTVRIALLQFVSPMAAVLVDWCVYKQLLGAIQLAGLVLTIVAPAIALRKQWQSIAEVRLTLT